MNKQWKRTRGAMIPAALVAALSAVASAKAAEVLPSGSTPPEGFVAVSEIDGLKSVETLANGDIKLTLTNGSEVVLVASDVTLIGNTYYVSEAAIAQAGLALEGAPVLDFIMDHPIMTGVAGAAGLGGAVLGLSGKSNEAPALTSAASATVVENSTAAYTATATDPDGDKLTFSIDGGSDASRFAINADTGAITFVAAPNFEAPVDAGTDNTYDIVVKVSDGEKSATQNVSIRVTNVNDVPPVFTSGPTVAVAENTAATGYSAAATDVENDSLTYSIDGGADAALFSINATTGALSFIAAPNFEAPGDAGGNNVYDVTLKVSDGVHTATRSVAVTVTNVNDVPPVFTSGTTVSVAENTTATGYTAAATDVENDGLTYSIDGGADAALFSINATTGALSFIAAPNFEAPGDAGGNNVYDVTLKVSDGVHTATRSVAVTVTNVNDVPPVFTSGTTVSVAENTTATGYTAAATDVENDGLTYSIDGGADAALFSINATTGALSFIAAPNFEAPGDAGGNNVYDVTLKVSDGVHTATRSVAVTVTNVNDVPPVFTSGTTVSVAENTTATGYTAAATDVENDGLTYSIDGGADAVLFSINATTGALSFIAAPNFEAPGDAGGNNVYDVTVKVSDGVHTATRSVAVTVTNVNDVPPVFTSGAVAYVIEGNLATGYTAAATDAENDSVTYSVGGADAASFSIDSATGALSFVASPDFESPGDVGGNNVYDVIVRASDGVNQTEKAVAIHVTTPPELGFGLSHDSGFSEVDLLTNDAAIAGQITGGTLTQNLQIGLGSAPGNYVDIGAKVAGDGSFALSESELEAALGTSLTDGDTTLSVRYIDGSGRVVTQSLTFELDQTAPSISGLALSATSDTGAAGDLTTSAGKIALTGQAQALTTVSATIDGVTQQALVNGDGRFTLNDLALSEGANLITVQVTDAAGNVSSSEITIQKEAASGPDAVLFWNTVALQAVVNDGVAPTYASRGLAMQSVAVYDVLAAIDGSMPFMVAAEAAAGTDADAAIAFASAAVLKYLFPRQAEFFDAMVANALAGHSGAAYEAGKALGETVGGLVAELRDQDGWNDFAVDNGGDAPGQWSPTEPAFNPGLDPQWADLKPFAMTDAGAFTPEAPPALTSEQYTQAYNELLALGSADSTERTEDQTQIANFWRGNAGTVTPSGMWNQIAAQIATTEGGGLTSNARLFALLNLSMADAGIAAWNAKYEYDFWRPIEAIRSGGEDGNEATIADEDWRPLLLTPNFPEYVSGHSTYSAAAATVLTELFGEDYAFDFTSSTVPGVSRHFDSFEDAASEAGRSRIYGGIHFEFSNQAGQSIGREVAANTLAIFNSATDETAPTIFFTTKDGQAFNVSAAIEGTALDTLSGLESLTGQIDDGTEFAVTVNGAGHFSIPVAAGLAEGSHSLTLTGVDAAGNEAEQVLNFVIDTLAPDLAVTSFAAGATLSAGARLGGTVDATGSDLVKFSYAIDGGQAIAMAFDGTAKTFDTALPMGALTAGDHTVVLTAQDAAGNVTTQDITFHLDNAIPLTVVSISPQDGASEVGVTQRPQVTFSRPVDPASLTADTFYATDATGAKVPARIVMSADKTSAYLFFDDAMKGAETFRVHLDGDGIRALADGALLDGDDNGTPGGGFTSGYTTVSTEVVPGTVITGFVVGPGADLKPMTQDDFRSGPDGVPFTDDDVFLEKLAGVKVFILGREDEFVLTDDEGRFTLTNVPSGNVKIAIDGRTASNAPDGAFYPEMVMDLDVRPGVVNTIMGTMGETEEELVHLTRGEVYLPRLSRDILQDISDTDPTIVTALAEATQGLSPDQASKLTLTVQPGSIVDENGDPVLNPQVGISTVPPELVRDMLPPGVLQHTFDITIQVPEGAVFTEPAVITLPNVFGAAPGSKLNILSFDHTTGRLVINGTGTVSADGLTVVSDEGSGITKPGWHGLTPPSVEVNVPDCFTPKKEPPPADDCSPGDLIYKSSVLTDLANSWGALGLDFAKDNLLRYLRSSGDITYQDGSAISTRIESSGVFKSRMADIIDEISRKITLSGEGDQIDGNFGSLNFYLSGLDLALGIGSSASASPYSVKNVRVFADGTFSADVEVTVRELYNFRNDAQRGELYKYAKDLEDCNEAQGFEIKILTSVHVTGLLEPVVGPFLEEKFIPDISSNVQNIEADDPGQLQVIGNQFKVEIGGQEFIVDAFGNRYSNSGAGPSKVFYLFDDGVGSVVRGTGSPGEISVSLTPNTEYLLSIADQEGNFASARFNTAQSGTKISLPNLALVPSLAPDSDGDGLTDEVELVFGTGASNADTDGDGLTDKFEIDNGLDPLGGFPTATGVLATIDIGATINDIVTYKDGGASYAAVAAGSSGLVLIDISAPLAPVRVAVLDLPTTALDVDVDPLLQLAAVATGGGGLKIIDLSDPNAPVVSATVAGLIRQVEVLDSVAIAGKGGDLIQVDLTTGEVVQTLSLSAGGFKAMTREGNFIYALSSGGVLTVVELLNGVLISRGTLSVAGTDWFSSSTSDKMFVADGVLYIPADRGFQSGYATVSVADPANMSVISGVDDGSIFGSDIALNGSGLGIVVGESGGVFGTRGIDVVRTGDSANTGDFVTRFTLNATPNAVAIGAGFAYVGDANGGFHVVNYQAFDTAGVPPVITLQRLPVDIDAVKEGIQVQEGQTVSLGVQVTDDAQVRQVEILINGVAQTADIAYPWDMRAKLPSIADNGSSTVTLQIRATDSGGNITLSDPVTLELVPDTIAPVLVSASLVDGAEVSQGFRSVRFTFDEALANIPDGALTLKLADGTVVAANQIFLKDGGHTVQATFPALAPGDYELILDQTLITDRAGNALGVGSDVREFTVLDSLLMGAELQYQYLFGSNNSPYGGALNFTVSEDVEMAPTFVDSPSVPYLAYYNSVDVGDDTITITFTGSVSWNGSAFNGFRIRDVADTVLDFTSVQDDDARTTLSFDANSIYVNWAGRSFNPGDKIVIHINDNNAGAFSEALSLAEGNTEFDAGSETPVASGPPPAEIVLPSALQDAPVWAQDDVMPQIFLSNFRGSVNIFEDHGPGFRFMTEMPALATPLNGHVLAMVLEAEPVHDEVAGLSVFEISEFEADQPDLPPVREHFHDPLHAGLY